MIRRALVGVAAIGMVVACAGSPEADEGERSPLRQFTFPPARIIATVPDLGGEDHPIRMGGHSGLTFRGREGDVLTFVTHPDRGPNGEPTDLLADVPGDERPFPVPGFEPGLVVFTLDLRSGAISVVEEQALSTDDRPISGRPNLQAGAPKSAHTDEVGVTLSGERIENDPLGADLEGIAYDARDGSYWLCDEYRPSIYHVDASGRVLDRFVPIGTSGAGGVADGRFGRELLPALYAERRQNRGFEAIALRRLDDDEGVRLYVFLQSPLVKGSQIGRVLEVDVSQAERPEVIGEFIYPLDEAEHEVEKIGDASWLGDSRLAVIEQNSKLGPDGRRYVTEVDLTGATNLLTDAIRLPEGTRLEDLQLTELTELGIAPLTKRRLFDLVALGFEADKVEGLAVVPAEAEGGSPLLVIVNDDDFGLLDQPVPGDGRQPFLPQLPPSRLGVLTLE